MATNGKRRDPGAIILGVLRRGRGVRFPGRILAFEAGCTTAVVSRWVGRLRAAGHDIAVERAAGGRAYRLALDPRARIVSA